ncbi:sulfurtransferase complex subunit TusB [Vibrio pectenicida]|uniref:Sulfurtransferase complex subunit TusB n=1 Tax=Vibrio pectenicida TaxID=62763 RepID=A0A3R9L4T4_9VIBR|nr:sulfurtransferase complex subunit TusB [Vibrio pectenicida]RSD32986.1 sulfurtransferase complex subunit TusB [Vibrio pectenicida]RSD33026.1 sulfurtransferase complex subunit TusB [Vibrio pectenicida]
MLHILKSITALEEVNKVYLDTDILLLIQDAVYAVNPLHRTYPLLKKFNILVLKSDLEARGMLNRVSPSINVVDYEGFVDLTVEHATSLTWD